MAIDLSTLSDYSWADIAKAAKQAMVSAALGGATLTVNGRVLGRISIQDATLLYKTAVEMQAAEAGGEYGNGVLIRFGTP